jgi:hypothetical protein
VIKYADGEYEVKPLDENGEKQQPTPS